MCHLLYRRKKLTPEQEQELCKKCQFCCRYIIQNIRPTYERIQFFTTWGLMLLTNGRDIGVLIPRACQHITDEGCKIYDNRPEICKNFMGGDSGNAYRPFCLLYEPISEDEKAEMLKKWSPLLITEGEKTNGNSCERNHPGKVRP